MDKFVLTSFIILISGINSNFLRYLQPSSSNEYDYSNYKSVKSNEDLTGETLSSSTADQSVVYITSKGITIKDSSLTKESGDSSNIENSEFYGVNSAVLVQGGETTISGGQITTKAKGANALCATNGGSVQISNASIKSTGSSSARGLHATYGGTIIANDVNIITQGGSCASLATDRGEGQVTCTGCILMTEGAGSPLIYSTGTIILNGKSSGTASGAQMVVVEGKNTASVTNSDLKCSGKGNRNNVDKCGVMLYQSQSGDAGEGTAKFNCQSSTMEIESSSDVYSSAPMFFITNTDAEINLNKCKFTYGSGVFLNVAGTSEWGKSGENGGDVTLNLVNQNIEGDFTVDSYSELIINMVNSTIKGTINKAKTADKLEIKMDSDSSITLTGNSYYTKLTNDDSSSNNINKGDYTFSSYGSDEDDDDDNDDENIPKIKTSSKYYKISLFLLILIMASF